MVKEILRRRRMCCSRYVPINVMNELVFIESDNVGRYGHIAVVIHTSSMANVQQPLRVMFVFRARLQSHVCT